MTEAEGREKANKELMAAVLETLLRSPAVANLSGGKVGTQTDAIVRVELSGIARGIWPLPEESQKLQQDFTVTCSGTDERTVKGLLVAVQKAFSRACRGIMDAAILGDTGEFKSENGVFSRNDLFAAIIKVNG